MSNTDASLASEKVDQEYEKPKIPPNGKQQQADMADDHQRKTSRRRHSSQTPTIKIAPRPANIQPAHPSPCINVPPNSHTNVFPPSSAFLPGVDDNISSPLPFTNNSNNQMPFLTMVQPTPVATANTNNYTLTPNEITKLPVGSLPQFDLSQATDHSVPPTHTPGNLCENDTMLKDLMAYYTPHVTPTPSPSQQQQSQTHSQLQLPPPQQIPLLLETDPTGQEAIHLKEKRADNRARKKRWREQNEERNKDNDLRCRVNKRAHSLFGREDNEAKRRWVESEFLKRQCRRRGKRRQMEAVDDALSTTLTLPANSSQHKTPNDTSSGHLPILQDAYLSMLLNNMGSISPEAALKLMEGLPLMEATLKNELGDLEHALPQQLAIFLQQLQKLHASAIAPSPGKSIPPNDASTTPSPSTTSATSTTPTISAPSTPPSPLVATPTRSTIPHSIKSPPATPADSTSIQTPAGTGTVVASSTVSSSPSPASSSPASSSPASPQHIKPVQDGLSAMLIQSLQQTAASFQVKQEYTMEPLSPATTECSKQEATQQPTQLYSNEDIMKLMQMNQEWNRQ